MTEHRRGIIDGRLILNAVSNIDESFDRPKDLLTGIKHYFRDYCLVIFDGVLDPVRWYAELAREERRLILASMKKQEHSKSLHRIGFESPLNRVAVQRLLCEQSIHYEIADYHRIPAIVRAAMQTDSVVLSNDPAFFSLNIPRGVMPMIEWHPLRSMQPTYHIESLHKCLIQRLKIDVPIKVLTSLGAALGDDYNLTPHYETICDAINAMIDDSYVDNQATAREMRIDFMQLKSEWQKPYRTGSFPPETLGLLLHGRVVLPCLSTEDFHRTSAWSVTFRIWSALLHCMEQRGLEHNDKPAVVSMRVGQTVTHHYMHAVSHPMITSMIETCPGTKRSNAMLEYWNSQRELIEDLPIQKKHFSALIQNRCIEGLTQHDQAQYQAIRYSLDALFWYCKGHECSLIQSTAKTIRLPQKRENRCSFADDNFLQLTPGGDLRFGDNNL